MSFNATCPRCLTSYRLPERQAGKRVRCNYCTATFVPQENPSAKKEDAAIPFVEEVADSFKETTKRPPYEHFQQEDRDRRLHLAKDGPEDGGRSDGGPGLIFGFVGAVMALLVLAGGMAWYFTASPAPPAPPPGDQAFAEAPAIQPPAGGAIQPTPAPALPPVVGPKDIASALAMLQGKDVRARKAALEWLKAAMVEEARRDEVAQALNDALEEGTLRPDALQAVARWGGKANTDKLVALLNEPSGLAFTTVLPILAQMDDDRAVAAVARHLPAPLRRVSVAQALEAARPRVGEREVVKYLNHPDEPVRVEAERLLKQYSTGRDVLIKQSCDDLEAKEILTRRAACLRLKEQPPAAELQGKVARALADRLEDPDPVVKLAAMAALDPWATKECVKPVCAALQHLPLQPTALKILARLKQDESIEPLVNYLVSPNAAAVAQVLVSFGGKAEKPTWRQLENPLPGVRELACRVLAEVGGRDSIDRLTRFGKAYPRQKKLADAAIKQIRGRVR